MTPEYKTLARVLAKFLLEEVTTHSNDISIGRLTVAGAEFSQWFLDVARPQFSSERITDIFKAILEGREIFEKDLEEFRQTKNHDVLDARLLAFEQLLRDQMHP
jgi:hypothetical protein